MTDLVIAQTVQGFVFDGTDSIIAPAQAYETAHIQSWAYNSNMSLTESGHLSFVDQSNVWQEAIPGQAIYARIESNVFLGWRLLVPGELTGTFKDINDYTVNE